MSQRNWIVDVSQEEGNPLLYGPYVEHRAKQIRDAINKRGDARPEEDKLGDYLFATAYPLKNPGVRELVAHLFDGR